MVEKNTEEKIVKAAEKIFTQKGLAGARMQEIADEAGINKSLLHYYYRSKEKLFKMVFQFAFKTFAPDLLKAFQGEGDFFEKIEHFVQAYLTVIEKNPYLPGFILTELSSNPDRLVETINMFDIDVKPVIELIEEEIEKGTIHPTNPMDLIVNIISLCIFPIVAKPMIKAIVFKGSEEEYKEMLERRKVEVARFVIASIKR